MSLVQAAILGYGAACLWDDLGARWRLSRTAVSLCSVATALAMLDVLWLLGL